MGRGLQGGGISDGRGGLEVGAKWAEEEQHLWEAFVQSLHGMSLAVLIVRKLRCFSPPSPRGSPAAHTLGTSYSPQGCQLSPRRPRGGAVAQGVETGGKPLAGNARVAGGIALAESAAPRNGGHRHTGKYPSWC